LARLSLIFRSSKESRVHAVVEISGKQFTVHADERVRVPRLSVAAGSELEFDQVLLVADGAEQHVGAPRVDGARVTAEVLAHGNAPRIEVFHKKRRKGYKRLRGHKQPFSEIRIRSIQLG
jgi:large subunit ribosomal protein L21